MLNLLLETPLLELSVFDDVELGDIFEKLSDKNTQLNAETQIDTKEGSQRYLALSFSSISNDDGEVKGIAIIARNVTNERIADEKIKQANAELEEKVAVRNCRATKSKSC
ncbi:PAS domain-containing protein [Paraglaciecola sp. Hal342]